MLYSKFFKFFSEIHFELFIINIIGLGFGPSAVGIVSDILQSEYGKEWKIELDKHLLKTEFDINKKAA